MLVDVIEVKYITDYRLFIKFNDGFSGEIDFLPHLDFAGVFAPLRSKEMFAQARVEPEDITISWPTGADWAPETLYEMLLQESKRLPSNERKQSPRLGIRG